MMLENGLEELALTELSPAELRAVLERIGQAELGGSDAPTVRAVAEATGRSTVEVGSLLADLRGEAFQHRFEQVFTNHESRIRRLEQGRHPMSNAQIKDYSHDAANFRLDPDERRGRKIGGWDVLALVAVVLVALWIYGLGGAPLR